MRRTLLRSLCFLALAVLAGALPLAAQSVELEFRNPPKAFRPMVRWWWPGGAVTSEELSHEIDLMDQAGFGGAEIQPLGFGVLQYSVVPAWKLPPLSSEQQAKVNDYLTPSFFRHVTAALKEARARGMWVDYTFGSGWPFGGAGAVTPQYASMELKSAHQTIRGPVRFHARLNMPELSPEVQAEFSRLPAGWAAQFKAREKLVAVVAVKGSSVEFYNSQGRQMPAVRSPGELQRGTAVVLTSRMQPDGTLDWNVPPGVWQVFTFKEMPTGETVAGGVGPWPKFVLNHMSRKAFAVYADHVGGSLKKYDGQFFGNTLRAVFCDSLEVTAYLYWDDNFLDQFKKLRGYDLTPYLPLLKVIGEGDPYYVTSAGLPLYNTPGIGKRVRRDYWQTVSDVMFESMYGPLNGWAHENHLLTRVQAHGSPTDLLRTYGEADIPETENLYNNGSFDFRKMASSAGDLYGRKIVSAESFVWQGKFYQATPQKVKRSADAMLTEGINEIVFNGFTYRRMDRPFPGWSPFQLVGGYASNFNAASPFFSFLPKLNAYITRLEYISQTGTTVVPVALYRAGLAYPDFSAHPRPEPEIDIRLMNAGYSFDHIDASVLLLCHVEDAELVSPGGARYKALVIPNPQSVSRAAAEQIIRFAGEGLPIVFIGGTPGVVPAVEDGRLTPGLIHHVFDPVLGDRNVRSVVGDSGVAESLSALAIEPNLRFESRPLPFIQKRLGKLNAFFLSNPRDVPVELKADFPVAGSPELWDAWTGEIRHARRFERRGAEVQVSLHIKPYGSALLVFDPAATFQAAPAQAVTAAQPRNWTPVGQNGWKFHGAGIGPGSKPETIDLELPRLEDWAFIPQLMNFSGSGTYSTSFTVPTAWLAAHHRVILDLGDVQNAARISVNGKPGPELLMVPYRADITRLVHAGENVLQVTVVSTLFNAISAQGRSEIYVPEAVNNSTGGLNAGNTTRLSNNGLMPSGLIGPVVLREGQ